MTPIPTLSPAVPPPALPGVAPVAGATGVDFAALLPGFVVPVMPRQGDAEGGKDLPAVPSDEEDGAEGAAAIWVQPPLWPAMCPPVAAVKGERRTIVAGTGSPAVAALPTNDMTAPLLPGEGRGPVVTGAMLDPGLRRGTPELASAQMLAGNAAPSTSLATPTTCTRSATDGAAIASTVAPDPIATSTKDALTSPIDAAQPITPSRPQPQAELQPLQPTRIAPAAEMFAAAIQRAVRDERRPASEEQVIALAAPTADLTTRAVAAAEGSRHAALDMARDTWPTKMIERIEMLRDAADAVDTSIRLVPDKLGAIDVSLRRDGDGVQVQFTAQQAETRQLLAEAQPKLAELAEAKGLRLAMQAGGGASGDNGAGGQQHQPPRASAASSINPPHGPSDDDGSAAEDRVA
jgi:Meckel syndrome type 1 protein